MINTFKVVNRKIELPSIDEKVSIYFFGDIHRFAKSCDVDRWHWFLKNAKEHAEKHNTFFFGLGDYDDFASTREKADLSKMHETTIETFDEMNETRTRVLAKEMSFMRGKVLGLIEGNHHWVYVNGGTTTMDLAARLEAEYLGWLCHYTLKFEFANRPNRPADVHFVLCHGKAGGKTAGITINQVSDMKLIFPMATVYCVSDDTEILTNRGWLRHEEIDKNDTVVCIDQKTSEIKRSKVLDYVSYHYNGDMVNIKNKNTDQLMIPEHRVYFRQSQSVSESFRVKTAGEIHDMVSQIHLPLSGFTNTEVELTDEEIAITGWIVSEGTFKGQTKNDRGVGILIYQKKEDNTKEIYSLLDKLQYQYSARLRDDGLTVFYIKKESAEKVKKFVDNKKRLPHWVYYCSDRQFNIFFNAFVLGDGSAFNDNCGTIYSAEKNIMDDFQSALSMHGFRSNLKFKKGGFKDGSYVINYCKRNVTNVTTWNTLKKEPYSGVVWCVKTEHGNFIARRNGKVFVTGNCMGHDHQRGAWPQNVLMPVRKANGETKIKQLRQFLCRSGSFKKAYEANTAGYEIGRLLKPADLGAIRLDFGFHRDRKDGNDEIIVDITSVV